MRIVLDTKKMSDKLKDMTVSAKENVVTLTENAKENAQEKKAFKESQKKAKKTLPGLQDDLDYLELIVNWNVERLLEGKLFYVPLGLEKETIEIIKREVGNRYKAIKLSEPK